MCLAGSATEVYCDEKCGEEASVLPTSIPQNTKYRSLDFYRVKNPIEYQENGYIKEKDHMKVSCL